MYLSPPGFWIFRFPFLVFRCSSPSPSQSSVLPPSAATHYHRHMSHAILTALGADRPGLVDEVSRFIFERGGNIEDSRMVNLSGQFAMMVLLGGDEPALSKIRAEL